MQRTKFRRKSSSFRPQLYYDSAVVHKKTKVELLPVVILSMIFGYLNTSDLLSICRTSKLFYLPAIMQLYGKIVIVNDDEGLIRFIKKMVHYTSFGTIINFKNIDKLISVVENTDKVARYIKQLVIVNDKIDFNDDSNFGKLQTLVNNVHLHELINPSLSVGKLPQLNINNLSSLTIAIKQDNQVRFNLSLPWLRKLKFFYENKDLNKIKFQTIAHELVDNHILDNLQCLIFEELIIKDLRLMNETNNNLKLAIWMEFFQELTAMKLGKYKKLCQLSLDGFINNQGPQVCQMLSAVFDLSSLTSLTYHIKEFSHLHEVHYNNTSNLLINLMQLTPRLTTLNVSPTFNCLTCQLIMIIDSLKMVTLHRLNIKFELLTFDNCKQLMTCINHYQPNVQHLSLYDKSNEFANETEFRKFIGEAYNDFERHRFNLQLLAKNIPIDYDLDLITRSTLGDFYHANAGTIGQYLQYYIKLIGFHPPAYRCLQTLTINNIDMVRINGHYTLPNHHHTVVPL